MGSAKPHIAAGPGRQQPPSDVLSGLLGPMVRQVGADLEAVEVRVSGGVRLVRVVVDRDGGMDLDAIAAVSTEVSAALDAADVLGDEPYTLEVTSPGTDRPLTLPRHWARAVGRLVRVRHGHLETLGRVRDSDEESATLDTDSGPQTVLFDDVQHAAVEVEFAPPPSNLTTAADEGEPHGH